MLKSFFSRPNVLLRLLVVLVFAGGLVFAATYDGFSPKIQAENSSCCGGTDAVPTEEPVAQTEVSGCCGGGTDTLLADGAAAQSKISASFEKPMPTPAKICSYAGCVTTVCFGSGCTNGCGGSPRCNKCNCQGSQCKGSGDFCSSHGSCVSRCTKVKVSSS